LVKLGLDSLWVFHPAVKRGEPVRSDLTALERLAQAGAQVFRFQRLPAVYTSAGSLLVIIAATPNSSSSGSFK